MTTSPRARSVAAAVLACLLGAVVLAGCGEEPPDPDAGTNGVAKLTPKKIEAKTRSAASDAEAVRLAGTVISKGKKYRMDMRLTEDGGVGEMTLRGHTFELLRIGEQLYLKADESFYLDGEAGEDSTSEKAARKLAGKYVKVSSDDPAYRRFSGFTHKDVLLGDLFVLDGRLAVGKRGTVNGTKTVELAADGGHGGALAVSLQGKPYPLRYERAGDAGVLTLSDWNEPFTLKAPEEKQVLDYGEEITGAS
ncbi:hypothetical protein [Streptomyces sp. SCUT-3]|uniref:hypothetical protein n=1 Tax=Streptomyces sp. SCUT-3 TaxID=2684469 RepID=UPI002174FE18|nr:hypothetical protein [Streptomyces sp. SCUT-3]